MYVKQRTWLENGPRPRPCGTTRMSGARSRGMGSAFTDWCDSPVSISDPGSFALSMVACLPRDIQKTYTSVSNSLVYGDKYVAPPAPAGAGTTSLVPTGGTDVAGNPEYDVVDQSPDEVMADWRNNMQNFMGNLDAQVNNGAPPWWILPAAGVVVAGLFFLNSKTGRRR